MNSLLRSTFCFWGLALAALLLTSCDKVWQLSQKLKADEEPEVVMQSTGNQQGEPVPLPVLDDLDAPYASSSTSDASAETDAAATEEEEPESKVNREAEVSILGYHDFSDRSGSNDMVLYIEKFKEQMEALKENEVPVISMTDYLAWRRGEKDIPKNSVVLTFDDGWKSVYTHAFPVMKQYGYPFSIYLYKNYVEIGGRSMTWAQIKEMMEHGCEVGSHSVSHSDMSRRGGRNDEQYEEWLREELGESMRFLRENLGDDVLPVFAYPYGKYNQNVIDLAKEYGYEMGITVAPKKAGFDAEDYEVGRYIVHQTNNINFGYALSFRGSSSLADSNNLTKAAGTDENGEEQAPLVTTLPAADQTIGDRQPLIEVDVSKLDGVVGSSIAMEISGLGDVPFEYDEAAGKIRYQLQERLRSSRCTVNVRLKRMGESKSDNISWDFFIDRKALYMESPLTSNEMLDPTADLGTSAQPSS